MCVIMACIDLESTRLKTNRESRYSLHRDLRQSINYTWSLIDGVIQTLPCHFFFKQIVKQEKEVNKNKAQYAEE